MAEAPRNTTTGPDEPLPPLHGASLGLLTVAIALATFMEILDTTIVNVSVPAIGGSLGVSPNEGTWAISSYSLAAAIMQPLTGWIGRRFGEVRTFCVSVLLFVLLSAICGFADSMPTLVLARLLQGAVSGPMVPMAQALLVRNFPPKSRAMAMALWAMIVFVAPIFGPIVGGWITDNFSWPWIFYINIPLGLIAAWMVWSILRKRESRRVQLPIDVVGLVLLVVGVGSLQYMLDNGNDKDWFNSKLITAAGLTAVVCLTYLVAWEWTDKHPVIDLHLFAKRNFRVAVIATSLGFACFFGSTVLFPLWLQTTVGYTATWAGLATAPAGILGVLLLPIIGKHIPKMNLRAMVSFGFLVFGATIYWVSTMNQTATFWQMTAPRFWQGIGMVFFFLPLNMIMLSEMDADHVASAVGLSNFLRSIGGSTSTALTVWLWTKRTDFHHAVLAQYIQGNNWGTYAEQLRHIGVTGAAAFGSIRVEMLAQARTLAANDIFRAMAFCFWLLIPVVWFAKPPFRAAGAGGGH